MEIDNKCLIMNNALGIDKIIYLEYRFVVKFVKLWILCLYYLN